MNDSKKFDMSLFENKYNSKNTKVIQLGSQLRYLSSIYKLKSNLKNYGYLKKRH